MQKITFEVCAGSYQDCLAAEKGGADRVELNSALKRGWTDTITYQSYAGKEGDIPQDCVYGTTAGRWVLL